MRTQTNTRQFEEKINYFGLCEFLYKEIKRRDDMLEEYAYITSHELRAPVARIKGLINVFDTKKQDENLCYTLADRLKKCANELDEITHVLNKLTEEQSLEIG